MNMSNFNYGTNSKNLIAVYYILKQNLILEYSLWWTENAHIPYDVLKNIPTLFFDYNFVRDILRHIQANNAKKNKDQLVHWGGTVSNSISCSIATGNRLRD